MLSRPRRSTRRARPVCRRSRAAQSIAIGESDIVVVGGIESMSRMPYLIDSEDARWGHRMGNFTLVDAMYRNGFTCSLCGMIMGGDG
jgi:acetyl-CoA C-acetyltransferase